MTQIESNPMSARRLIPVKSEQSLDSLDSQSKRKNNNSLRSLKVQNINNWKQQERKLHEMLLKKNVEKAMKYLAKSNDRSLPQTKDNQSTQSLLKSMNTKSLSKPVQFPAIALMAPNINLHREDRQRGTTIHEPHLQSRQGL